MCQCFLPREKSRILPFLQCRNSYNEISILEPHKPNHISILELHKPNHMNVSDGITHDPFAIPRALFSSM